MKFICVKVVKETLLSFASWYLHCIFFLYSRNRSVLSFNPKLFQQLPAVSRPSSANQYYSEWKTKATEIAGRFSGLLNRLKLWQIHASIQIFVNVSVRFAQHRFIIKNNKSLLNSGDQTLYLRKQWENEQICLI